ncbi:RNA polymerase sigma-70 factor, ECF subfamily [Rubritalea squalenifaciens DSM 18772]|uniref:RNA polymerase sigma-70 factor, ECF subfamily n=2 Tax=Rubritalea TaxID=361050 RepID=A0A1M6P259_9BACT|nr:RNA polymerase sigma factor [Rubritalea squalenifaciens]SHK01952.1 RNA polymerase sigma-70 factor, ECF subfamily [Rubritalea squalenifaciens DSM 18772]
MSENEPFMTSATATAQNTANELSWGAWLTEHGSKLLLFARQQTRSLADAEDVLQDSLVKLAGKVADGTFDGGQAAWLPYLYTTIRRCAIDLGRKDDRRSKREEKVEIEKHRETGGKTDPWFESDAADDEMRGYLEMGLKELPQKFAEVIVMKVWGDRTFAEIGEALDISQNTAASRYRYGLEALRKHLAGARRSGDISI